MSQGLRIFVTGHSSRHGGGISVARNLIAAFGRVAPQHQYFFTIPDGLGFEECCQQAPKQQILVYRHGSMLKRWFWETYRLPQMVKEVQPDVIINLANRGILHLPAPQSTLIHDPHLFYGFHQFGKITLLARFKFWYHQQHLRKSLRHTQLVFCQTETAMKRIKHKYGGYLKVEICPNSVSVFVRGAREIASLPQRLTRHIDDFRVFFLTRYYSHKNIEILIRLFLEHREKLQDVVVITTLRPDQHPNAKRFLSQVAQLGLQNRIVNVGPLQQDELDAYYSNCNALFLPTLLESFSGTYFESMHFGCPILTSNLDFAREICGDAALYFDPLNPSSIADAIVQLKSNPALQEDLIRRGKHRLGQKSQTWDEIAMNVIKGLEDIAAKPIKFARINNEEMKSHSGRKRS